MSSYEPGPELTKAVLAGILAPLPFVAGMLAKRMPYKEAAVAKALQHVVPTSLRAIASTRGAGARIALTRHGELTEETKQSVVRNIAAWFVPSEVHDVTKALQQDIIRLGRDGFGEEAWKLEATEGEIVLVVIDTSFLKASADTVADLFMDSFERLKDFKNRLPFSKPAEALVRGTSLASRLAGLSALGPGTSWKPSEPERAVVRDLLAQLEDKRALYTRAAGQEPAQVVASIESLEPLLSDALSQVGDNSPARDCCAILRAACRAFMALPSTNDFATRAGTIHAPDIPAWAQEEFFVNLGKLRQTFGQQIAWLGYFYGVDIDGDLASLLPPEAS